MKTQIEKWLEKRRETVSKEWTQEYQYMLVLVLFWGFGTLTNTLKGLEEQRKIDAEKSIKAMIDDSNKERDNESQTS